MPENGKKEFEGDEVSLSDGGNAYAHVNNEDGDSHDSLTCCCSSWNCPERSFTDEYREQEAL